MEKKAIKSPYMEGKKVEKSLTLDKLVEDLAENFFKALSVEHAQTGKISDMRIEMYIYVAGCYSTLKACGFEEKDAWRIGTALSDYIKKTADSIGNK